MQSAPPPSFVGFFDLHEVMNLPNHSPDLRRVLVDDLVPNTP